MDLTSKFHLPDGTVFTVTVVSAKSTLYFRIFQGDEATQNTRRREKGEPPEEPQTIRLNNGCGLVLDMEKPDGSKTPLMAIDPNHENPIDVHVGGEHTFEVTIVVEGSQTRSKRLYISFKGERIPEE